MNNEIAMDAEKHLERSDQRSLKAHDGSSSPDDATATSFDAASMKRLTRRLDIRVMPPLFTLFLMSFLDRGNIGNARIQGLEASLDMKGQDYSIALFVFFIRESTRLVLRTFIHAYVT